MAGGTSVLRMALSSEHEPNDSTVLVCRLLAARGADVCAMGVRDFTPLQCSVDTNVVCALLLAEGAQASVHVLNCNGDLPLEAGLDIHGADAILPAVGGSLCASAHCRSGLARSRPAGTCR